MKKSDLIDKLTKAQGDELTAEQLLELAGVKKGDTPPEPAKGGDPEPTKKSADDEKGFLAKLRALFKGEEDESAALKKAMPAETRAYVERLEATVGQLSKSVEGIVAARKIEQKTALTKRIEGLKKAGVELDPEKASEAEVTAHEAANERIERMFKELGITVAKGSSESDDEASVREEIRKEVRRRLGREPANAGEEIRMRRQIYEETPGLLDAVRAEEIAEAKGGV